jgi:C4-dicarboxylate-specific signal transduction histidine kinase
VITLGELAASIAHEVNQPLAAVVTSGEACLRWIGQDVPRLDKARDAVGRIIANANRASEVIGRIRALARKSDPQKAPVDVREMIEEIIPLVQREMTSHRIVLELDLDHGLPQVLGDRVQLQQVIINLLVNSIEAMASVSGRRRALLVRARESETGQVVVSVKDSGEGIDPDNMDRLFTAFFTTKPAGMGMGLAICRSIADAHGGRLWVLRDAESGATFHFSLPSYRKEAA